MHRFEEHPYAAFLHRVEKPARYAGGETGEVRKDWSQIRARVCLAFPDVYDIGMSHLGYKILYKVLNDDPRTLAERCYAPWIDMEAELRRRKLPLVSLESGRPLSEFDVVGLSLQFELTYTNCLTILDLGQIPIRSQDRTEGHPLILGGGPTATHPEPIAPFFDAFVVGDGEEKLKEIALAWVDLRSEGLSRRERLARLAALGGVYVPTLYSVAPDRDTGLLVVEPPRSASPSNPPWPVRRTTVADLNAYPFPVDGPVGGPESVFERMSIEIARGCTEGCRFCQAGMIYRPVRERDPEQVVASAQRAVSGSGYDEISLTSLSTADYSCISPLIHRIADVLADQKVAIGVSSLRAYGLEEDLLARIGQVRATGLTFAPEAGTQRMRDVINKNITEEQLLEAAHRVFSRGWPRMKLYFMIGLPTETDEDVVGIVTTSSKTQALGRRLTRGRAKIATSVSSHVPKPHTPFQWCAMDAAEELQRKQSLLASQARAARIELRLHSVPESFVECVFARGDRALADVIEHAWRAGARFDSWQDQLRLDIWRAAFAACGIDPNRYTGELPVEARLPWDHIDVGLAAGFLVKEHRKALVSRPSPPCGKQHGRLIHHTRAEDAIADERPLICYECGAACDLEHMRQQRIDWLTKMPSRRPRPAPTSASTPSPPLETADAIATTVTARCAPAADPPPPPADHADCAASPAAHADCAASPATHSETSRARARTPRPQPRVLHRYRFRFEKLGASVLLGHLDLVRAIPRLGRRAGLKLAYTQGFHPKPYLSFSPALSLGTLSLAEYVDMQFLEAVDPHRAACAMTEAAPSGLRFTDGVTLEVIDPPITRLLQEAEYWVALDTDGADGHDRRAWWLEQVEAFLARPSHQVARTVKGTQKAIDVRSYVESVACAPSSVEERVRGLGIPKPTCVLEVHVALRTSGGVKVSEIVEAIAGASDASYRAVRAALSAQRDGALVDPLDVAALRAVGACP